jgi:hypothetical protein
MIEKLKTAAAGVAAGLLLATGAPALAVPTVLFSATFALQVYDVPAPGDYRIVAAGAAGGNVQGDFVSGLGAWAEGIFTLNGTEQLQIIVGRRPPLTTTSGGGGGGSFVYLPADPNVFLGLPRPLVVGGGGGGAVATNALAGGEGANASLGPNGTGGRGTFGGVQLSAGGTNGGGGQGGYSSVSGLGSGAGGGGGFYTAGGSVLRGGHAAMLGAEGGEGAQDGGFGGGGASVFFAGGGGGGYSGGGGGGSEAGGGGGGGGGSYVNEFIAGYVPNSSVLHSVPTRTPSRRRRRRQVHALQAQAGGVADGGGVGHRRGPA